MVIALLIAVFDILPVLGTGGIMIPWAAITAIQGRVQARAGAVRGIYRGHDHPYHRTQDRGRQSACIRWRRLRVCSSAHSCSGVVGLFRFPIGLSLLRYLNEQGTIKIFK